MSDAATGVRPEDAAEAVPEDVGQAMHDLLVELFPINRSLTGDGVRRTLARLGELMPITIHEIPTGTMVGDWEVPREWVMRDAYIEDPDGRRIAEFSRNNLHVVGYSTPVDARMSLEELQPHLYSQEDMPDAIPYVTSYYAERWGFCLPHNERVRLKPGTYRAVHRQRARAGLADLRGPRHPGRVGGGGAAVDVRVPPLDGEQRALRPHRDHLPGPLADVGAAALHVPGRRSCPRRSARSPTSTATSSTCAGTSSRASSSPASATTASTPTCRPAAAAPSPTAPRSTCSATRTRTSSATRSSAAAATSASTAAPGPTCRSAASCGASTGSTPSTTPPPTTPAWSRRPGCGARSRPSATSSTVIEGNRRYRTTTVGEPQLGKRGLYPQLSLKHSADSAWDMVNLLAYADGESDLIEISDTIGVGALDLLPVVDRLRGAGLLDVRDGLIRPAGVVGATGHCTSV